MKITELNIYTKNLKLQKYFFSDTLGFDILQENEKQFTIKAGWSRLTFIQGENNMKYHYCFLIPSNKLNEALTWMEKRTEVIKIAPDKKIQHFESWNAYSFYFYDADGNVAEFIIRKDLKNDSQNDFSINDVLCVNEVGLPTRNIDETNDLLSAQLKSSFWKGNTTSFGTNGTQEGLILLPNYEDRTNWFPTDIIIQPAPFKALIENNSMLYHIDYNKGELSIQKIQSCQQ